MAPPRRRAGAGGGEEARAAEPEAGRPGREPEAAGRPGRGAWGRRGGRARGGGKAGRRRPPRTRRPRLGGGGRGGKEAARAAGRARRGRAGRGGGGGGEDRSIMVGEARPRRRGGARGGRMREPQELGEKRGCRCGPQAAGGGGRGRGAGHTMRDCLGCAGPSGRAQQGQGTRWRPECRWLCCLAPCGPTVATPPVARVLRPTGPLSQGQPWALSLSQCLKARPSWLHVAIGPRGQPAPATGPKPGLTRCPGRCGSCGGRP